MSYSKVYFEIYAALALVEIGFLKEDFHVDWIKEKPDIQTRNFGIEVTRDYPQEYGELIAVWNSIAGLTTDERNEKLKTLDKKRKLVNTLSEDKMSASLPTYGLEILDKAIQNKHEKFDTYKKFLSNGLFIFSAVFMLDAIERDEITKILKQKNLKFSHIFLISFDKILLWDNQLLEEYELTGIQQKNIRENVEKYVDKYFDNHGNRKK